MRSWYLLPLAGLLALLPALSQKAPVFSGRWDLTVVTPRETYPSWIEFGRNGVVRLVSQVASVHKVDPTIVGNRMTFTSKEWFGQEIPVDWTFEMKDGKLTGHQKRADGIEGAIAAAPAPALNHPEPAAWTKPESLFNGKDLTGWIPDQSDKNHWKAVNGELVNDAAGANIHSTRKLGDFKLHLEFNCPDGGNSGIYLRSRYEIQVEYEPVGTDDEFHGMGAVYGFLAPSFKFPRRPGSWESYDATLVGRTVTVARNGKVIIDHKEIPGITGGAIDSREAEPAPLFIQGDHTGGMKYRNITVQLPAK